MQGNVYRKIKERGFGFIVDEDRNEYFFHLSSLKNIRWIDLMEGDSVIFDPIRKNNNLVAINIMKNFGISTNVRKEDLLVYPGMHSMIKMGHFLDEEKQIIKTLSKTFYVTNGGGTIELGSTSEYKYCFVKPSDNFKIQFNLGREIIVIFSPYDHFEPRTFDAISEVYKRNEQQFRIDKICSIVISKDNKVVEELHNILKNDIEMQVIIPFSYGELLGGDRSELIISRFRDYFFERDLFAFEAPLKKDIYFFGRRTYVHDLINRHNSGENSGVFGLRRSGKTSVLEAITRASDIVGTVCVMIDCQELYHYRWNKALLYVMKKITDCVNSKLILTDERYSEEESSGSFSDDLKEVLSKTHDLLLMFDEVEQITPGLSLNDNWKNGDDFVQFWHAIRSNFHKWANRFTFILAGTNPSAVEMISCNGHDNPLFNQLKADSYLPPFDVDDTKEMINKLGGYMGLEFDDIVCANLAKDFGGHPYLIRHYCSVINEYVKKNRLKRPIKVTNAVYEKVMPIFVEKYADNFCRFILEVLVNFYPEENTFLENLALGNTDNCESIDPKLLSHLLGYNIIEKNQTVLGYRIEVLKNYMIRKNSYKKQNMTTEEKWAEISKRRNDIEPRLRIMVKNTLKSRYGVNVAKQKVINSIEASKRTRYSGLEYAELFDPKKGEIYFSQLGRLIETDWETCFKNVFSHNKPSIKSYFVIVNNLRAECHAAEVTDDEMNSFRGAMSALEKEVNAFF